MKKKVLYSIIGLALFSIGLVAINNNKAKAGYKWTCPGGEPYCEYADHTPSGGIPIIEPL